MKEEGEMKAVMEKKKIEILDWEFPVEGRVECEVSLERDTLKIALPRRETVKKAVERVIKYLENPDSECDIETMASALEIDTN
jgi:hypothetical protein